MKVVATYNDKDIRQLIEDDLTKKFPGMDQQIRVQAKPDGRLEDWRDSVVVVYVTLDRGDPIE